MKVSVCVPTYNHENYIASMLEGALMQRTNFPFEIVVGDDASTDRTQEIIRRFEVENPGRIRSFLHIENQGPAEPKEFAGRNNVLALLKACRGEYVAMCEGDDYWTDPFKLQKQVDFLDANPDYAICHHHVEVIYEDGSPSHLFNRADQSLTSSIEDLLEDRWFMATASWMYRNYFLTQDFADWHAKAAAGDWALMIQIAAKGKIGFLPETMGIYRKHQGGLSHVHADTNRKFLENRKQMFERVNAWTDFHYNEIIQKTVSKYDTALSELSKIGGTN